MPILSANRIGGVRKDISLIREASTFGVGAFSMLNISHELEDFNNKFSNIIINGFKIAYYVDCSFYFL